MVDKSAKKTERSRKRRSFLFWVVSVLAVLGFVGMVFLAGFGLHFYLQLRKDLPDVAALKDYRPSLITTVYSDADKPIGTFYIEKRILLPLAEVPDLLVKAFIAVEDARFYQHNGIDLQGISRAFWANYRAKHITQGGSTITQQLAKTLFLSPERKMRRKLKEMLLAMDIEQRFSKDEVLELYLNQIYFGAGAYGVEAAAQTYFGKPAGALTLGEMAVLASLPKSPSRFDPFKRPEEALARRAVVLSRMESEHFITAEDRNAAEAEPLKLAEKEICRDVNAYFIEHVRRYLMERYGSQKLYQSGLEVYTTMNQEMQQAATVAVRTGIRAYDKRHGYRGPLGTASGDVPPPDGQLDEAQASRGDATESPLAICVDQILEGVVTKVAAKGAWVGVRGEQGFLPFEGLKWAKEGVPLDRSGDPDRVRWIEPKHPADVISPGDRILVRVHPFDAELDAFPLSLEQEPEVQGALLALNPGTGEIKAMVGGYDYEKSEFNRAVQAKRQPGSAFKPIIYGAAIEKGFSPASIIIDTPVIFQDPNMEEKWKPANYSERFYGPTRLRVALAKSRNVVTVKLLQKVGIGHVINFAQRIGITSPLAMDYSLALGSSVLTLQELTAAYGVFANGGQRAQPYFIRKILDYDGNVVEENHPPVVDGIDPDLAYIVTNMLEDVVKYGTGREMKELGRPTAGKTGTTNNFLDALYLGFVPDLVAGVWVGYDDMRPLGQSESGSKAAGPIWLSFMKEVTRDWEKKPFIAPPGVIFVKVDAETGLLPSTGSESSYLECFKEGSEPREFAPVKSAKEVDFFEMDSRSIGSLPEHSPSRPSESDLL